MRCNLLPGRDRRFFNDLFHVVFHGSDGQPIAFFGDEERLIGFCVQEDASHGQVFDDDLNELVCEMECTPSSALAGYRYLMRFEIQIIEIEAEDLADPEADAVHQGIDTVIPNAQDRRPVKGVNNFRLIDAPQLWRFCLR